jgi:hypothetical protein
VHAQPVQDQPARLSCRRSPQDYDFLSGNVAVRASASSTARDAAAAQQQLTAYMVGVRSAVWVNRMCVCV